MTASPDYFYLDGQRLVAIDNGDGTKTLVVSSTGGGGGGSGAAGTPVLDNAGVRWLWVYDAAAGTSTYISFATGSAGTPTFPVTPDADTSVQVSNFPATQPVSAVSLPLPTDAATEATLAALNTKVPAQNIPNLLPVDTLGTPGVPRVQATSAAAAGIVLTTTCRRVSMYATQGTWYSLSGTATTTSHYIAAGERLDFDVPANTTISVLQETTAGSIRITELT